MERLGYIPNEGTLVKSIQAGKLKFLHRQSNRVTRWEWTDPLSGTNCILIYDKIRKQIVTVFFKKEYKKKGGINENISSGIS